MTRGSSQRDKMRELVLRYGADAERVIREYAAAEVRGEVRRESNRSGMTAESYARALYADGAKKGWFRYLGDRCATTFNLGFTKRS